MSRPRVCIILPTLNEEEAIGKVIDEIPWETLKGNGYDVSVMVVDGNSTDRTRQIAEDKGARQAVDRTSALEATYTYSRRAVARGLGGNVVWLALLLVVVGAIAGATRWRLVQYGILGACFAASAKSRL